MTVINPEEGDELKRLHSELEAANWLLLATLVTNPAGHDVRSEVLHRYLAAEADVATITQKIKNILGPATEPLTA